MKILIAEDDPVSRHMLEVACGSWGYIPVAAEDGSAAWKIFQEPDAPPIGLIDWMMPVMDGLEFIQQVRQKETHNPPYLILLTARGNRNDIVRGLRAQADDYVTKPFDHRELRARLDVGRRVIRLQTMLAERVQELENALSCVKSLQGLLPICSYCKRIRNDGNYWQQVESYVAQHSEAEFTHGVCPECYEKIVKTEIEPMRA
jgi:phosphoserine phosphatase RsbU/P